MSSSRREAGRVAASVPGSKDAVNTWYSLCASIFGFKLERQKSVRSLASRRLVALPPAHDLERRRETLAGVFQRSSKVDLFGKASQRGGQFVSSVPPVALASFLDASFPACTRL